MGDRALVIFVGVFPKEHNGLELEVSPTIYTHWSGRVVEGIIEGLDGKVAINDAGEAFVGFCSELASGREDFMGFSCWNTPAHVIKAIEHIFDEKEVAIIKEGAGWAEGLLANYSHGDRGIYVVDCRDFSFEVYGGSDANQE